MVEKEKKKSIFSIKLVRYLSFALLLKIIGFVILFFLFFSPNHRVKVTPDKIIEDVFRGNISQFKEDIKIK